MKIEEMGLSTRAVNALKRANIHTVFDLRALRRGNLIYIRGIGVTTYSEIIKKLETMEEKERERAAEGVGPYTRKGAGKEGDQE